jgi:hypothetical protein
MYTTTRNIAGGTLMTCKDCGSEISMNKMCEKPLQAATDMLKHMAAHNASPAVAAVERLRRPAPEAVPSRELAPALGIPAVVDRVEPPITQPGPLPPECVPSGYSQDQLSLAEALLTM